MALKLANFGAAPDDIDLLVASDAEEILGIGRFLPHARDGFHRPDIGTQPQDRILSRLGTDTLQSTHAANA